jgi:hypothetical protein
VLTHSRKILNLHDSYDLAELARNHVHPKFGSLYSEVEDPGPFVAAAIALNPHDEAVGVVRAVRWRKSFKGPFTPTDELTLSTCVTLLAALARVWRSRAVVISYGFHDPGTLAQLKRFLEAVKIEPLCLDRSSPNIPDETPPPVPRFTELMGKASAGIVLATPDKATGGISDNVMSEAHQLKGRFGNRMVILHDKSLRLPPMINNFDRISFSTKCGLSDALLELAERLKTWLQ